MTRAYSRKQPEKERLKPAENKRKRPEVAGSGRKWGRCLGERGGAWGTCSSDPDVLSPGLGERRWSVYVDARETSGWPPYPGTRGGARSVGRVGRGQKGCGRRVASLTICRWELCHLCWAGWCFCENWALRELWGSEKELVLPLGANHR